MLYLKPNVIAEPLFNQWYAWTYLIPPATAAKYVSHSHIQIMESFVAAPQVHVAALQNPAMIGGPFIHYSADRAPEIEALLEKTKIEQQRLLELDQAIAKLDHLLKDIKAGYSLEPLYARVPEILRGYVELVYDRHHNPGIRFIEGLLYRSEFYNPTGQSILLHLDNPDTRSFVLSTPRLSDQHSLQISLPFGDRRWDRLFEMRDTPKDYDEISEIFNISQGDESLFSSFFTEHPPSLNSYDGDDVRIRYFGHACVLIETKEVSILCDPLIAYENLEGINRYTYADLPKKIDYVLITHNHQDHVMFETLLQIRHKVEHIVVPKSNRGSLIDPSLKLILQQIGFTDVKELDELETISVSDGEIISLPVLGEHGDLNISAKNAYLIQLRGKSILCAADSNNIEPKLYKHLYDRFGKLDVMFIGMECDGAPFTWAYEPLLGSSIPRKIAETRRLNGSDGAKAIALVNQFSPQQVYIYAMGQEPWLTYITSILYTPDARPIVESNKLVQYCQDNGIVSERLYGNKEIILNEAFNQAKSIHFYREKNYQPQPIRVDVEKFIAQLQKLDIKLSLDGNELCINAPKGKLTNELIAKLKQHKPEIIERLKNRGRSQTISVEYLKSEAILDPNINPQTLANNFQFSTANEILLTGVTGFVGAFILAELIRQTTANIYCLVRAENVNIAADKLKQSLKAYRLTEQIDLDRIVIVTGDLSKPKLNLNTETYEELATKIDTIYHNGALVHHASPYSSLKATNVLGTEEILRLACTKKLKPVHFISTISVFNLDRTSDINLIAEQDNLEQYQAPLGGYSQSKWVAEKLVSIAGDRGLPVKIYRLGPISGSSQTGAFNSSDFLYRLLLGYVHLGSAPQGEMLLDILPVDYVSRAIAYLSQQPTCWGKAFHLIHPHPVSSNLLFDCLIAAGYKIDRVPYSQWYAQLIDIARNNRDHILYPLVSLFSASNTGVAQNKSFNLKFDCHNTLAGLANSSITCPPIDEKLIDTYIHHLIERGLLPKPEEE